MTKTLIVPVDGSEASDRAWASALLLAERFASCDLVLLRADLRDGEQWRRDLEHLAAGAGNLATRIECVTGDAAGAIVRLARHEPDAVVCMATHGRGRIRAPLLGSVATDVLRGIDTPVLLVGPHCTTDWWHEPAHLVTCWAGEPSNPALAVAASWADDLAMDVTVLSVFHPLDVDARTTPAKQFAAAQLRQPPGGRAFEMVALYDDYPSGAITDDALERPASLLALTTRARTGLGRAVLGSVAMDVVHHSPCPVVAVRATT